MPGQTLSVTLLDGSGNVVERTTVPVYGSASDGVFVGDLGSGGISWRGDSVNVQIGTKFDKNHKPIEGVPLETWTRRHGGRSARFVIVMVEGGSRGEPEKNQASKGEGTRANGQPGSPVSTSGPTGGGTQQGTEKRDPGPGGDDRETHDGTTNQPGHSGPGKIDGGAKGGTRTHGHEGGVASGGHGGEFGKADGNKRDVGIMWDPRNAHRGQEDVAPENASPDGMAGGDETKKTGEGVPEAWGWKPLIKVPKSLRGAVSVGLILLQADVASITEGLVGIARKLGAVATKDFLRPLVRKEVEGLVERNLPKAVETLSKDAAYAGKSATELEQIARASLQEEAAEELAKDLDRRIADAEKYAQSDRAQLGTSNAKYAADDLQEEEAELEALRKVRGAITDEEKLANAPKSAEPKGAVVAPDDEVAGAGPGAASVHDESFAANRVYEGSEKHTGRARKVGGRSVGKEPTDGPAALESSVQIDKNSPRRVGVDARNNEFVVFDRTGNLVRDKKVVGGTYHGHVRTWEQLDKDMKDVLIENHLADKRGRINVDPAHWDDP